MKADISLAERRRIEREQQAEIRAMLVPRHYATMQEQIALDAVMHRLECEALIEAAPAIYAAMGRTAVPAAPAPAPVVMPEPEPVVPVAPPPAAVRAGAPDLAFDLRHHLGLR